MKPSSCKEKGMKLQKKVRDLILAHFPLLPDDVRSTSRGAGGVDILLSPAARKYMPYDIECKNVEKSSLWADWAQTVSNAVRYRPLLFKARNNFPDPLVVMYASDFFELLKKVNNG